MAVGRSQYHVLAVDDTLTDRKLIERILKTSSFHVTVVDSGSKALEFLESKANQEDDFLVSESIPPVNMIITDYSMPEMTGYELLVKIKRSESLKDIPVVIMSSENIPARIERCIEEGAEEFLLKPMRLSHVEKIKPLFDLNPTLSHFLRDSKEIAAS